MVHHPHPSAMAGRPAFTLVELLVVVGIIGLLVSILLPALQKARIAAGEINCLSNIRQLSTAIQMYTNDNKFYLPRYTKNPVQNPVTTEVPKWRDNWIGLIFQYTGPNAKIFECPLRQFISNTVGVRSYRGINYYARLSYTVNGMIGGGQTNSLQSCPFGPIYDNPIAGGHLDDENEHTMKIMTPALDTIMLCESLRGAGENSILEFNTVPNGYTGIRNISCSNHWGKSACFAYFDGHCEVIPIGYIFYDKHYDVAPSSPGSPNPTLCPNPSNPNDNSGPGDVLLNSNSTNNPKGYWSFTAND